MTTRLQSSGIAALSFTLSAGVLAFALTPALASAAPIGDTNELTASGERIVETRRVETSDLNLASAADLKTLDGRIRRAIGEVCSDNATPRTAFYNVACRYDARRSADQQLAALRSSATLLTAANGASQSRTISVVASR
jgi:UrcA family protein